MDCNAACLVCDGNPDTCFGCKPSFFLDVNQCLTCGVGCLSCVNASVCITCDGSEHFHVDATSGKCVCDSGYYIDDTATCLACFSGCQTCNAGDTCI